VDTLGIIIDAGVTAANLGDRQGLYLLFEMMKGKFRRSIKKMWADMGYSGAESTENAKAFGIDLEVVARNSEQKFQVARKRWVVERTFGWLGKFRRLSKDYELCVKSSRSWIFLAMSRILLRRLAEPELN
jgi:putative transposase